MCGIVGIISGNEQKNVAPLLIKHLKRLEYRGYDSSGIAIVNSSGNAELLRCVGEIDNLQKKYETQIITGSIGISHTRWATHGVANETNAHPHKYGNATVVHNGIVENYQEIKDELQAFGYAAQSNTDTEVVAMLADYFITIKGLSCQDAFMQTIKKIRGSFAILMIFANNKEQIFVAKHGSPIVIATSAEYNCICSDLMAIADLANEYYYMKDGEIAIMQRGLKPIIINADGAILPFNFTPITSEMLNCSNNSDGFDNFMLKEIQQQPLVIKNILNEYIVDGNVNLKININDVSEITFIGCGSANHVGIIASYYMEKYAKIKASFQLASEFCYRDFAFNNNPNHLFVFISQSGETIDTISALKLTQLHTKNTLGIINSRYSTMANLVDNLIACKAGVEVSVASTKAFTAQLFCTMLLCVNIMQEKNLPTSNILQNIQQLPNIIENIAKLNIDYKMLSARINIAKSMIFTGRNICYGLAIEGALKMKELSYIHCEGIAAGELKHGSISLIDENIPVIAIVDNTLTGHKAISNIQEIISRGGKVICISPQSLRSNLSHQQITNIFLPNVEDFFFALCAIIPLQLLSCNVAMSLGKNIDKPRNLAKAVTVE